MRRIRSDRGNVGKADVLKSLQAREWTFVCVHRWNRDFFFLRVTFNLKCIKDAIGIPKTFFPLEYNRMKAIQKSFLLYGASVLHLNEKRNSQKLGKSLVDELVVFLFMPKKMFIGSRRFSRMSDQLLPQQRPEKHECHQKKRVYKI